MQNSVIVLDFDTLRGKRQHTINSWGTYFISQGFTQTGLAKCLGVSSSYISLLFSNKRNIPSHRVRQLEALKNAIEQYNNRGE